jgi:hypothetical protein
MAQDSIAYGESLLANIRDRNDKLRSQAKKEAKKDQWKSLAVNIGMSVADDIFAGKQAQILNNEEAMRNKIQITAADNYANGVIAEHGQAESYKGGVNSWLMDNIKNELDFEYSKTYTKGNRNEFEFSELVNSEAGKIFDTRLKEYNARLEATKEHLAGGNLARYNANMAQLAGKGTAGGALVGLLTKLTGNSNADLYNSQNEEILRQSKEYQETYNSTWKQTRSATLAKVVAENMPSDLGAPLPEVGTPITQQNDFGGEETFYPVKHTVGGKTTITHVGDDGTGKFNLSTPQAQGTRKEFDSTASHIQSGKAPAFLNAGTDAIANLDVETNEKLAEAVKKQVKLPVSSGLYVSTMEKLNKRIHAEAGAIIYTATKGEGWANTAEAKIIASEMVASAYINGNKSRALAGSGLKNPYHTMFAIESAIDGEKINNGDAIAELGNVSNLSNLYQAYRTETIDGRKAIDDKLQANNYFEGKTGALFGQLHQTIKSVIDQGIEVDNNILIAEYNKLFRTEASGNTETEVVVEDNDEVEINSVIGELVVPQQKAKLQRYKGRKLSRPEERKLMGQQSKYTMVQRANKELQRVLNLDSTARRNLTERQYEAVLEKAQNRFNKQFSEYKNRYGLKDNV